MISVLQEVNTDQKIVIFFLGYEGKTLHDVMDDGRHLKLRIVI